MSGIQPESNNGAGKSRLFLFLGVIFVALGLLFHRSFEPNQILFANDGPLGALQAENSHYPEAFAGHWIETHWLGFETPSSAPNFTGLLVTLLPAQPFMKVFAPLSLAFIGFAAWLFFRQLRFGSMVCLIGGLAAAMNMNFFSVACWGLGTWNMSIGSMFLALAAMTSPGIRFTWARAVLGGLAVGMTVMEGFDVGAILSIFAGLYAIFISWNSEGSKEQKLARVIWVPAVVVIFAVLFATHTITTLVGTQIQGIKGTAQDEATKAQAWPRATAGSVPKLELLRVIIPGVFGYRMDQYIHDTNKASAYWGRISEASPMIAIGDGPRKETRSLLELLDSEDPNERGIAGKAIGLNPEGIRALTSSNPQERFSVVNYIKTHIPLGLRHSGGGKYVGIFVTVLALFALANSFRRGSSPYSAEERRFIWFWGAVALAALLLALGRHGFLYRLFFELPYMSSIRNPEKFLLVFNVAWIVLAGYALELLRRTCLDVAARPASLSKTPLAAFVGFAKEWKWASIAMVGAAVLIPLLFLPGRQEMELRLWAKAFSREATPAMVSFFYSELAWFAVFLALGLGLILLIMNGTFAGKRVKWAWVFAGLLMYADLARSDYRWIEYFDVTERYATNLMLDTVADKPYEHRVTTQSVHFGDNVGIGQDQRAFQVFFFDLQNQMPARNIQSLDVAQMPRVPDLDKSYADTFLPRGNNDYTPCFRLWELTNTRFVVGPANDPGIKFTPENGFVTRHRFDVAVKPELKMAVGVEDLTYVETPNGPFGVFELTNALPRTKLFANWQVGTSEQETLKTLMSPEFDPHKQVIVDKETPPTAAPADPAADAGTASITSYKSRQVVIRADAKTPAILLLNDRIAPQWQVYVDGKPAPMLRCNYIMRGVYLTKGEHTVEFRFQPKLTTLYVSLSAWAVTLLVAGFLFVDSRKGNKGGEIARKQEDPAKAKQG